MAAKKTAKKTTEPAPAKTPTPVAKKAAKKAAPAKIATKAAKSPAPKAAEPTAPKITTDMIARAAYLNYRRRVEQGLPGDSRSDWLEAERQIAKS